MRWIALMLMLTSLAGCSTVKRADDILAWTQEKITKLDGKIDEVSANLAETRAESEALIGAWDADGDGVFTKEEAKRVIKDTAKGAILSPEKRKLLFDPELWGAIAASLTAVGGGLLAKNKLAKNKAEHEEKRKAQMRTAAQEALKTG